jgi:hypothetical protein
MRFERVLGPCSDILKRNMLQYNSYVPFFVWKQPTNLPTSIDDEKKLHAYICTWCTLILYIVTTLTKKNIIRYLLKQHLWNILATKLNSNST